MFELKSWSFQDKWNRFQIINKLVANSETLPRSEEDVNCVSSWTLQSTRSSWVKGNITPYLFRFFLFALTCNMWKISPKKQNLISGCSCLKTKALNPKQVNKEVQWKNARFEALGLVFTALPLSAVVCENCQHSWPWRFQTKPALFVNVHCMLGVGTMWVVTTWVWRCKIFPTFIWDLCLCSIGECFNYQAQRFLNTKMINFMFSGNFISFQQSKCLFWQAVVRLRIFSSFRPPMCRLSPSFPSKEICPFCHICVSTTTHPFTLPQAVSSCFFTSYSKNYLDCAATNYLLPQAESSDQPKYRRRLRPVLSACLSASGSTWSMSFSEQFSRAVDSWKQSQSASMHQMERNLGFSFHQRPINHLLPARDTGVARCENLQLTLRSRLFSSGLALDLNSSQNQCLESALSENCLDVVLWRDWDTLGLLTCDHTYRKAARENDTFQQVTYAYICLWEPVRLTKTSVSCFELKKCGTQEKKRMKCSVES